MENMMMCKGCGKPETECMCPNCPCKGGECEMGCVSPGVCACFHHKIVPILIILFGLAFLLQVVGILSEDSVRFIWPILVILGGAMKLFGGSCGCYNRHY